MGRWSQSRRRATAAAVVAPPPPSPVSIVSVGLTGGGVVVNFDGPVTLNANPDDGAFTIATANVTSISTSGPNTLFYGLDATPSSGDAWSLAFQPSYIDETAVVPEAGTIT